MNTALLIMALLSPSLADSAKAQATPGADPRNTPGWVHQLPVGDRYVYFRGEGIDADPEKAKIKARSDAFRKAMIWTQKGHTSSLRETFSLSDTVGEQLSTASEIRFDAATLAGAQWVEDWNQVGFDNPYSSYAKQVTRAYVLLRYPKPPKNFLVAIGQGVGGRVDAVFHSALYPGWGQSRQGRYGEAGFFMTFGTLAGLAVGGLYIAETAATENPGKTWNHDTWRKYRRGTTYAFAGVYAANLLDALLFGREAHDYIPGGLAAVAGSSGDIGLQYRWVVGGAERRR